MVAHAAQSSILRKLDAPRQAPALQVALQFFTQDGSGPDLLQLRGVSAREQVAGVLPLKMSLGRSQMDSGTLVMALPPW